MKPATESSGIPWGWVALVAAVAVIAALAALDNGFAQDDLAIVVRNPRMQSLAGWRELLFKPYWPPPWTEDHWRPLTSLLLLVQYHLGDGGPVLFRVMSVMLYAAGSVGVLLLARMLVPITVAVLAALLFAVHPLHVEAVALAVGQAELLVALLAVGLTGWYLHRRRTGEGELRLRDWLLLVVGYVVAVLVKEHGLVLPGFLVAAELTVIPGPLLPKLRRLWPGFLALLGLSILAVQTRTLVVGDLVGSYPSEALDGVGLGGRALTMLAVTTHWVRLLFWPAHLRADYSPQELVASTGFGGPEALGLALLVGVLGLAWWSRRAIPTLAFGVLWTAVGIFPVSNLVVPTSILIAERTLFLASVGAVLGLVGAISLAWRPGHQAPVPVRRALLGVGGMLVALGVARTVERWSAWQDETSYVLHMVQDAPRSFRAQRAYGEVLFLAGRRAEGMAAYGLSLQYAPATEAWRVRNDLARRYFEEGSSALAVQQLRASRDQAPAIQETWNYLILGLLNLGEYPAARQEAESALARGFSVEVFEDLRALADTAMRANVPPGAIRINVVRPEK